MSAPPRRQEVACQFDIRMDEVTQAVENLNKEWSQVVTQLEVCIAAIESCGKMGKGAEEESSLPRLNGSAQNSLQLLNALQSTLDLLVEQLPTFEEVKSGQATLGSWKEKYQKLRASLRNANLQAKANIRKAAQAERELLLGGGEESTLRRQILQTKAGTTSAAGSITESLRRSRQLMVQEVERSANTLSTFDESTTLLRKAEGEYQGHRSSLMRTRGLLSTMQRQDVLDRIILTTGFLIFSLAVLYVVSRRVGLLALQRRLAGAIRSGSVSAEDVAAENVASDQGQYWGISTFLCLPFFSLEKISWHARVHHKVKEKLSVACSAVSHGSSVMAWLAYSCLHVLPLFRNLRCFRFVK